jgi:amino acid permease|tara:strand:- start:292 stop:672 length:381 start_codon:yes stop_codon:yes gene_type:complete
MNETWSRRRWYDFRQGHGMYLVFAMSFVNFVLIFYRLLIEQIDFLGDFFSNLWVFVIIFLVVYIPAAVLIGNWHRKTQMRIEHEQSMKQSPLMAKNFRVILDLLEGKASIKEVEDLRKFLKSIESG